MRAFRWPRPSVLFLSFTTAIALLAGCAASRLGNMWRDESFQTTGLKNVLVIAMRNEQVRRRLWEDSFSNGLAAYGAKATPSYKLWVNALPDTQQVIEAVRRDGYDGVLVNMRAPDTELETWVQGYTRREAVTTQNPFTGAYYTYWKDVEVPGHTQNQRVSNFRTDVWTTGESGRLVWSGSSQTTDGVDVGVIKTQTDKLVLPELSKMHVLAAKK